MRRFTRNGYDFTARFPKIAAAVSASPVQSCIVDGAAIVVNRERLSVFDLLHYRHYDHAAVLCAQARPGPIQLISAPLRVPGGGQNTRGGSRHAFGHIAVFVFLAISLLKPHTGTIRPAF